MINSAILVEAFRRSTCEMTRGDEKLAEGTGPPSPYPALHHICVFHLADKVPPKSRLTAVSSAAVSVSSYFLESQGKLL